MMGDTLYILMDWLLFSCTVVVTGDVCHAIIIITSSIHHKL